MIGSVSDRSQFRRARFLHADQAYFTAILNVSIGSPERFFPFFQRPFFSSG